MTPYFSFGWSGSPGVTLAVPKRAKAAIERRGLVTVTGKGKKICNSVTEHAKRATGSVIAALSRIKSASVTMVATTLRLLARRETV